MFSERLSFRGSLWQAFVRAEVAHSPPASHGDSSACPEPRDPRVVGLAGEKASYRPLCLVTIYL